MTTLTAPTVPARLEDDAGLRPMPWRQMAWVIWRHHRYALAGAAALFGAVAVYMWISGLQLHHDYSAAIACHPASSIACAQPVDSFNGVNDFLANGFLLQVIPALIGAFVGAPVLAREFEDGTFRFAWTQGFGRRRWTLAKLVGLAVTFTVATGLLSVLFSWYFGPYFAPGHQSLGLSQLSPLAPALFNLHGMAFAGWALAAFAIGALAGVLIRRVVSAMVATLVTYTGLAVAVGGFLRQHYLAALVTSKLSLPGSAWIVSQQWLTKSNGPPASVQMLAQALSGTPQAGKGGVPQSLATWQYLVRHGFTLRTIYQPAARFWPFQWIESGWLLGLAMLFIALTLWVVSRRTV